MIRGPKPICRHPLYFTVTITLSGFKTEILNYSAKDRLEKTYSVSFDIYNTYYLFFLWYCLALFV